MQIVTSWDYAGHWVASHVGKLWHPGAGQALGWISDDNVMCAGVTFTNFDGTNVWLDCAAIEGSRWLDRRGLFAIFNYVFEQLQCARCSVMIPESNIKSRKLVIQAGFSYEAALSRAAPGGEDMLIFRMFKEDCRWLARKQKLNG